MPSPRRDWALFTALTFCFSFGFAVYTGIFQNFFWEALHGTAPQLGVLESLREVPGLLSALLAGTLVALAETRLAAVALAICAVGVALTGHATGYWTLVALSVFWSVGGHLWFSVQPAITLSLAGGQEGGRHLGRMNAVGQMAVLAALAATRQAKEWLSYAVLFKVAGAVILGAGVLALLIRHRASTGKRQRLVYRREYRLYYLLTFLEGCRRQIFGTFATFALINQFHMGVRTMLTLQFINAGVAMFSAPAVGRLIDRFGERRMMTLYYSVLVPVFVGYAVLPWANALCGLYLVDSLLFSFSFGITLYLHRIVRPDEMTPSLAMGQTMNHMAAVVVPVAGGIVWARYSYHLPFWIGSCVALVSLAAVRFLPVGRRFPAAEPEPEPAAVA